MTDINSHPELLRRTRGKKTLVLLTAPSWCIPCKRFHPHWEAAKKQLPDVQFIEIDMGETPETTSEHWAYQIFDVRSVPTVLAIDNSVDAGTVRDTRIQTGGVIAFVKEVRDFFG